MRLPRRRFLQLATGAAALPLTFRVALAQSYPARSVRGIVPFGPGGVSDTFARLMAQKLGERLGRDPRGPHQGGMRPSLSIVVSSGCGS
jgi:tripartite-type tricarboxylate transporter receptor subunit TctC